MSEPVKKRSLGSYLSRLEERREERERSEQQQRESPKPVGENGNYSVTNVPVKEEEVSQKVTSTDQNSTKQPSDDPYVVSQANSSDQKVGSPLNNQESIPVRQAETKGPINEIKQETDEEEKKDLPKVGRNKHSDEEYSSALSEVESDAPTEPASPPRPKMGRLIRGDQLESGNNSRQSSAPVLTNDGESDSDLSDLDEARTAKISSSAIHEDSSPVKHYNEHKRKSSSIENSSNHKKQKHSAGKKIPKTKRGVHRDAGGRTKLQIACDKGKYDLAKKLIEEDGYDVNDQDNAGNTPLHEAALNGHSAIVELLVRNGANVNIQSYDMFLDTPLIDASANGHINVVKYLLDHGADPTMVNAKGLSAIESIEEESDMDNDDRRIVHDMKDMLKRATRKYIKHSHRTLQSSSMSRHSDDIDKQLNHDDDFYWTDISSKLGKNKLLKASKEGKLAYVGSYLENGGRPDFRCFLESCIYGHDDVVSLFLAFGAQVNMSNKEGQTPLMLSVGRGHVNVVKLLLEAGADPQKTDKRKKTALHYANHSSLGLTDPDEVNLLKEAVRAKYGYEVSNNSDEEGEEDSEGKSPSPREISSIPSTKGEEQDRSLEIRKDDSPYHSEPQSKIGNINEEKPKLLPDSQTTAETASLVRPSLERLDSTKSTSSTSLTHRYKSASPTHQLSTPPILPKESEEERAARLKSEEEYRQKRLQQKKRKEQEFLNRLAEDERKRVEEKEKLKQQEEQRLEQAKKEELLKEEELRNRNEVEKRLKIRERYPIGLRVIDFKDLENYDKFGPVYYFTEDGSKWVLDLQISVIIKSSTEELKKQSSEFKEVEKGQYPQLWNLFKFIFLYGGSDNANNSKSLPWRQLSEIDQTEYVKFYELPLTWIKLSRLNLQDLNPKMNDWIEKNMIEFIPASTSALYRTRKVLLRDSKRPGQNENNANTRFVPAKYQSRSKMLPWLNASKALW